ncbi:MAG: hypothetical protein FVQ79_13885 [Planctomycetes bacterium]|nr:hypothetical protein [Planctomycetota bacterium]
MPKRCSFVGFGVHGVSKYFADHSLFEPGDSMLIMNLDKWNQLPKHLQDLMKQVMIDNEPDLIAHYDRIIAESRQVAIDAGVEPVSFSPADAKWFRDTAYDAGWEDMESKVGTET